MEILKEPFDIITNNPGLAGKLSECTFKNNWNANICEGNGMALLQFESLDPDR